MSSAFAEESTALCLAILPCNVLAGFIKVRELRKILM